METIMVLEWEINALDNKEKKIGDNPEVWEI